MQRFEGKRALVTGAAGGIGQAIVERLKTEGAAVVVSDRDIANADADASIPGDLTDPVFADGLIDAAHQALGGLDIPHQQRRPDAPRQCDRGHRR